MEIPLSKKNQKAKKLSVFLEEMKKNFNSAHLTTFLPKSQISELFPLFMKQNKPKIRLFYSVELGDEDVVDEEIERTFSDQIYEISVQENFCRIYAELWKNQKEFWRMINFEKEVDFLYLMEFLNQMKVTQGFSLKSLQLHKEEFLKTNEYFKDLKKIVKFEKKNFADQTFLKVMDLVNEELNHYHMFIFKYFEKVLLDFGYLDEFRRNYIRISCKVSKLLLNLLEEKENTLHKIFNDQISKFFAKVLSFLENNLSVLETTDPKLSIFFLREFRNAALENLKNACKTEFSFFPSELFLLPQREVIERKNYDKFHEICLKFDKNHEKISATLEARILNYFLDFFSDKSLAFSKMNENQKELFYIIVITSLFGQIITKEEYLDNMRFLEYLRANFFPKKPSQDLETLLSDIMDLETTLSNVSTTKKLNYVVKQKWAEKISEELNLHIIFSILVIFQKIEPLNVENKKKLIKIDVFTTMHHEKLRRLLRNFQDCDYGYSNWDVLNLMEHIISRFMFPFEKEDLMKLKPENKEIYHRIKDLYHFEIPFKSTEEILIDLRNVHSESLKENLNVLFRRVEDYQDKKDFLPQPKKFEFEKLSKIETRSRVINLCISGFLSQESNKQKEWADLIDFCDRKNSELVTLNWLSSTQDILLEYFSKTYTDSIGLKTIHSFLPVLGFAKILIDNPFLDAFEEAKRTGFYLAHLIGDLEIFGNCVINLIGFSMGTIVIFECINELKKMGVMEKINDVIVMGGIINRDHIKSLKLDMINGRWIHCFSKQDSVLRYLFRMARFGENAIGIKRAEGDKKIINYDCSDLIDGHMGYREKLGDILQRIDFLSDYNYLLEGLENNEI